MRPAVRILILALVTFVTLGVSVASAAHVDSSPNSCNICFVAHAVAFETPSVQPFCGPEMVGRAAPIALVVGYQARSARPSFSRGPPLALSSSAH
jgi:hypothetical protein